MRSKSPPSTSTPVPAAPPLPERTDAIVVQSQERERIRQKRGRAATLLTGTMGDQSQPQIGVARLLG